MNAADLFKNPKSDLKPDKILKSSATNYWSILKPPYKIQDLFTLGLTFFLFLTIPLTVFVANQIRDNRGRAASGSITVFEENFKKLDLKFAAKEQKLTLIKKSEDDTLPRPEIDKKDGKNLKVVTFEIEQTNKLGQSIYTTSQDITIQVNDKGEAISQDIYFSTQVQDESSTVKVKLSDKKLLEVGI